ncbi:hypothetical protein CLAFUW4_06671 [Fulvia fulva]|nr:hypothetical protein CLAFUR4_06679 [Fulvia fulva]WPV16047.1 hypothetical protein CLAFUW4_06671 [Fulvia fulva]WPV31659.1 hypothetical protein CLAFUW7_06670 [Fulvia fulva]
MPNRLSKLFSPSNKEKQALAEAERNNSSSSTSSPPPEYQQNPPEYDRENAINPPDMTAGFSNLSISHHSQEGLPESEECIAHLKVLECFYRLKQTIGSQDRLFGIQDSLVTDCVNTQDEKSAELLAKLAEKRWGIYVQRAVDRFEAWWAAVTPEAPMPTRTELEFAGRRGWLVKLDYTNGKKIQLDRHNLPPVDVLMVWHSYMLNPRAYLEDCIRYGKMPLWYTSMPWDAVAASINSESFAYEAGPQAEASWTSLTGRTWDNAADPAKKLLICPSCNDTLSAKWTTCFQYSASWTKMRSQEAEAEIDTLLSYGSGFCDKHFLERCTSCQSMVDHDKLRVGKFCRDIRNLLHNDVGMAGTTLGAGGLPWTAFGKRDNSTEAINKAPNELLKHGLGQQIIDSDCQSVEDIRALIEAATADKAYMRKARSSLSSRDYRSGRIAIRKMMSRYWQNSSPFALDLLGAVIRQGSFIEKMHNIDWLHSPGLPSTMQRLRTKYRYFIAIIAENPLRMAVPTLDVDLAWHTHQLRPYKYMEYTVSLTRTFIDHDDKVAELKLNDSFAWTSKKYQKMTGQPYSECTCWYCEAVRESHTSSASRLFSTSSASANDLLHDVDQDPARSVHISAHNAVRPTDDANYDLSSKKKAEALEKAYQKACDRALKKGKNPPKRDDYYYSDAWGYPVYIPAYSPYVGFVPYAPMYYPVTPGCMAVGAGSAGNCCAGTCGGGVAAGSCGGAGGGCAGGAAGGCGGGGGGGGGGCGGGGGGGGCGGGGGGC